MNKKLEKKIVMKGMFENVLKEKNHLYLIHKLDKICVLPYTISTNGILDKVGVIKELDVLKEKQTYNLINGYISQDDATNLVAANRLLFEVIGSNIKSGSDWMYLGNLSNISIGGEVIIWAANISDIDINQAEEVEETKKALKFEMIPTNQVVASDDALFLASYMRLFNYFYVSSLQ
jgi:hypothetical protein